MLAALVIPAWRQYRRRERATALWQGRWQVLEGHLAGTTYAMGEGFCALDLYLTVLGRWVEDASWRREQLPRVEAIMSAVRARPALAPVWARHFPK